MTATLIKTIIINAKKEVVWSYLTDQEKLGLWFHAADINLSADSAFNLVDDAKNPICQGEVDLWNPPNELAYKFSVAMHHLHDTHVHFLLETLAQGTKVTLTHTKLPTDESLYETTMGIDAGWDRHLARLRENLNG